MKCWDKWRFIINIFQIRVTLFAVAVIYCWWAAQNCFNTVNDCLIQDMLVTYLCISTTLFALLCKYLGSFYRQSPSKQTSHPVTKKQCILIVQYQQNIFKLTLCKFDWIFFISWLKWTIRKVASNIFHN